MKSVTIVGVHYNAGARRFEAVKEIEDDDGSLGFNLHTFTNDILEQRAAEYGSLDLGEIAELVLWEPFLGGFDVMNSTPTDMLMKRKEILAERKQTLAPPVLNKSAIKARMNSVGIPQHYIDAADKDPIEVIKQHALFHHEVIEVRRAYLEEHRSRLRNAQRRGNEVQQGLTGTERAEAVRKQLFRQENMRRENTPQ
jgi:hypothetical protein